MIRPLAVVILDVAEALPFAIDGDAFPQRVELQRVEIATYSHRIFTVDAGARVHQPIEIGRGAGRGGG